MLVLLGYLKAVGANGFAFVDVEGPADLNPALLEAEEGPEEEAGEVVHWASEHSGGSTGQPEPRPVRQPSFASFESAA